jgi:hypothetical protein
MCKSRTGVHLEKFPVMRKTLFCRCCNFSRWTTSVWVWVLYYDWRSVSQSVCLGIRHPSGAYDQILITVRHLWVGWCGALSLTRGRACCLQLLLVLASAVILGSESRYCSRFETSLFVTLYDSQGYSGDIQPCLHTGWQPLVFNHLRLGWYSRR